MSKIEKIFIGFFVVIGILFWSVILVTSFSPFRLYYVDGKSMNEFGLLNDDYILIKDTPCSVGDYCVFQWDECYPNCEQNSHIEIGETYIKKLVQVDDNQCHWFEGNPTGLYTYDSRTFGCITHKQFHTIGVVIWSQPHIFKKVETNIYDGEINHSSSLKK